MYFGVIYEMRVQCLCAQEKEIRRKGIGQRGNETWESTSHAALFGPEEPAVDESLPLPNPRLKTLSGIAYRRSVFFEYLFVVIFVGFCHFLRLECHLLNCFHTCLNFFFKYSLQLKFD